MTATTLNPDVTARVPETLEQLVSRLERVTRSMETVTALTDRLPSAVAMVADTADEEIGRARANGVDVDARLRASLDMLERLTAPESMRVLGVLLEQLPQLERAAELARTMPGLLAMGIDSLDEMMRDARTAGVDVERGVVNGVSAAVRFGALMGPAQVDSIAAMLGSGVLEPHVVQLIGRMGESLTAAAAAPRQRVGVLGALHALRDPDVQRALGLLLQFAAVFGRTLNHPSPEKT
jgi:hypothetical protein